MSLRDLPAALWPLLLALGAVPLGCAPSTGAARPAPFRQSITAAELSSVGSASLYDAIARLRPAFLHERGPASVPARSPAGPLVVVDGVRLGPPSVLRHLAVHEVAVVRYLRGWDAAARYGRAASNGVIEVTTKR